MAVEKLFVKEGIKRAYIEEFLFQELAKAGYSHCEIQRTPLSTKITVFVNKPGLVIGRGGKNIDMMVEVLKEKFGLENPQLDVREVDAPALDAMIVAREIATGVERGLNYKRVANLTLQKVMGSGAVGISIRMAGKLGGAKSRFEKFSSGYMKHAGETAETLVKTGAATALTKPGIVGIKVKIMTEFPKEHEILKKIMK